MIPRWLRRIIHWHGWMCVGCGKVLWGGAKYGRWYGALCPVCDQDLEYD